MAKSSTPAQITVYLGDTRRLFDTRGIGTGVRGDANSRSGAIQAAFEKLAHLSALVDLDALLGPKNARFALDLLADPWRLTASEIQSLEVVYRSNPRLTALADTASVDLHDFFGRLQTLDYGARLALVDRAMQHHADTDRA